MENMVKRTLVMQKYALYILHSKDENTAET